MKHPNSLRTAGDLEPFFSIGVVTYNRREMLKECLASIRRQTFSDFGVIVGNDYPGETLSVDVLGIKDPRIRIINHPHNLGELNNLNAVLAVSRGRYFTWLGDDDLYSPGFLEAVHKALIKFDFPPCVFTSYMTGVQYSGEMEGIALGEPRLLSGRDFLREYLGRSLRALGCYGVFDIGYLRQIGGMEQLGNGFSPYSDVLLAIRCGLLERVGYIDAPMIFFRTHEGSISWTSPDVDAYTDSQKALCRESVTIFQSEGLRSEFHSNLFYLLRWCIRNCVSVVHRSGCISGRQAITYLSFLRQYIRLLDGSILYWKTIEYFMKVVVRLILGMGKARIIRWSRLRLR